MNMNKMGKIGFVWKIDIDICKIDIFILKLFK